MNKLDEQKSPIKRVHTRYATHQRIDRRAINAKRRNVLMAWLNKNRTGASIASGKTAQATEYAQLAEEKQ